MNIKNKHVHTKVMKKVVISIIDTIVKYRPELEISLSL